MSKVINVPEHGRRFMMYGLFPPKGEINKMSRMVQTEGYVPMATRIETLLNSGVRLAAARAEQYDADSKTPPEQLAGDRIRRLELLEGLYQTTQISSYIQNNLAKQKEELNRLKETTIRRKEVEAKQLENRLPEANNSPSGNSDTPKGVN